MAGPYNLGNTNNNQQQGHAGGFAGLSQDMGTSSSFQANGPDPQAYNNFTGNAAANQENYQGLAAAAQNRAAPKIDNQFQGESRALTGDIQGEYGGLLGALNDDIADPQDSNAVNQFRAATADSIAAQQAAANSARGGAINQAGAARAAQQQGATTMGNASAQAAQIAEQDRMNAIAQAGNLQAGRSNLALGQYGLEQGDAQRQAELQGQRNGQNDSYSLGLGNLANSNQEQQLQAINNYNQLNQGAQQINANTATNAAAGGAQLFGAGVSALGNVVGVGAGGGGAAPPMFSGGAGMPTSALPTPAAGTEGGLGGSATGVGGVPTSYDGNGLPPDWGQSSDPALKRELRNDPALVDAFLAHVRPKSYRYKEAQDEPTSRPTGGTYLGVSADDVASVPGLGPQLVEEGPRGKRLKIAPLTSATLAGLGRMAERLDALERKRG